MTNIVPFPKLPITITKPLSEPPATVIVLPVVHIERNPDEPADAEELALAERFIAARRKRRLKKLSKFPKLFLTRSEGRKCSPSSG